jgi:hypothetical protein
VRCDPRGTRHAGYHLPVGLYDEGAAVTAARTGQPPAWSASRMTAVTFGGAVSIHALGIAHSSESPTRAHLLIGLTSSRRPQPCKRPVTKPEAGSRASSATRRLLLCVGVLGDRQSRRLSRVAGQRKRREGAAAGAGLSGGVGRGRCCSAVGACQVGDGSGIEIKALDRLVRILGVSVG